MADDAERRLAAIMFTDMVGYSSLVEENEARALSLLNEHNKLLKAVVERHHGSLIKTIGDAFFVEFRSAFDACTCALAMQMRVADRNQGEPPSRQFQIRIGIHVGDVVVQDGDLFGDGVNVAARIESLAEPGGIALSEDAARQVDGKLPQQLQDLGPQSLKNLSNRVRIYRMVMPGERAAQRMVKRASHLRRGHGPLGWLLKSSPVLLIPLVQLVWPRLQEDVSARGLSSAMAWQAGSGTTVPGRGLIAFSSNRSGDFDLYVLELGGGLAQQVTSGAGEDLRPAWNRTAGKLVFQRTIRGNSDVRLVDINSHQERALTNRPGYDGEPCFTPDGRAVLYVSEAGGSRRLYRQAIDGGKAEPLEFAGQAVASPTSSVWANKVAWVAVKNGQRGVFVAPANALQQAQRLPLSLSKGEVRLTWRNTDGALLVFSGRTTRAWIDGKVADSHGLPRGEQFSWSPREAFVFCAPGQKGRDDLFVQTGGPDPINLTKHPAQDRHPAWAPPPSGADLPTYATPPAGHQEPGPAMQGKPQRPTGNQSDAPPGMGPQGGMGMQGGMGGPPQGGMGMQGGMGGPPQGGMGMQGGMGGPPQGGMGMQGSMGGPPQGGMGMQGGMGGPPQGGMGMQGGMGRGPQGGMGPSGQGRPGPR